MKLAEAMIVTKDVSALASFYKEITGITPVGSTDYLEFKTPTGAFAISSQDKMDQHGAAATVSASNHSTVLDFEVEDVDEERNRLQSIVSEFVLEPTFQPWVIGQCCFATQMEI